MVVLVQVMDNLVDQVEVVVLLMIPQNILVVREHQVKDLLVVLADIIQVLIKQQVEVAVLVV